MSNTKDPEAPYSDNETPGKPGWNARKLVARGTRKTKTTKKTTGHVPNEVNDVG